MRVSSSNWTVVLGPLMLACLACLVASPLEQDVNEGVVGNTTGDEKHTAKLSDPNQREKQGRRHCKDVGWGHCGRVKERDGERDVVYL